MSFEFLCQACGARLRIDDDLAGKPVKCPQCSAVVPATTTAPAAAESPFAHVDPTPPATGTSDSRVSPSSLPETDASGQTSDDSPTITPRIRLTMSRMRPWVLFVSIVGFFVGGLLCLITVGMLVAAIAMQSLGMLVGGGAYGLMATLYLGCSVYLFLYSRRTAVFVRGGLAREFEAAMVAQKSFWKLLGIWFAVAIVVVLVLTALASLDTATG